MQASYYKTTLNEFKSFISSHGYSYTTDTSIATGQKIIYVYMRNGYVVHFARKYTLDNQTVSGAATISKWGAASLYTTLTIDPYGSNSDYGNLELICFK